MKSRIEDCNRQVEDYKDRISDLEEQFEFNLIDGFEADSLILAYRFKIENCETEIEYCKKYIDSIQYALSLIGEE